MGMHSLANAANNAEMLKKILLAGYGHGVDVRIFCREYIYPAYLAECGEAFMKSDADLHRLFITEFKIE